MTDMERIVDHFNANVTACKRRSQSKPQIAYEPGCAFIECQHADCRCRMNDGDGIALSKFIATWQILHGKDIA